MRLNCFLRYCACRYAQIILSSEISGPVRSWDRRKMAGGEFNSTEFKSLSVQNLTQSMSLTVESLKELWAKEFLPNIRKEIRKEAINILKKIVDKHAPITLASQSKQMQLNKPWLTKGILKSVKRKQKMYRTLHY